MKRTACVILLLITAIFLVNPSPGLARGWHGGGHWGWWAPWAVIGGAALVAPYYYGRYYDPYYYPYYRYPPYAPPVVVQEPPPAYVQPAPAAPSAVPPAATGRMFIYPRQGQDEKQQANDRYECHRWAVGQTGYDPTKPPAGLTGAQQIQMQSDYQRAMGACLDGRGYTMR